MRAALYVRTSAADGPGVADEQMAALRTYADLRGWSIDLIASDVGAGVGRRTGLNRVIRWAEGPTPPARRGDSPEAAAARCRVILTPGLWRLFRNLRHVAVWGARLVANGVALVATSDQIDSTDIAGHSRWADLVEVLERTSRLQHSEAVQCARIRMLTGRGGDNWGRPVREVNPFELKKLWEGSSTARPLSLKEIARKLRLSPSTVRRRVADLLERGGQLNPETREKHLVLHGGLRKGGRPARKPRLRDEDLLAELYGTTPLDLDALARKVRVSKADLLTRLAALKLGRRR